MVIRRPGNCVPLLPLITALSEGTENLNKWEDI